MSNCEDPIKDPIVQEIVMSNLIGMVVDALTKRLNIDTVRAFELFYESDTCRRLHDKSTGLYLFSRLYIADDFMFEHQFSNLYAGQRPGNKNSGDTQR